MTSGRTTVGAGWTAGLAAAVLLMSMSAAAAQPASPAAPATPDHIARTLPLPPHTPIEIAISEGAVIVTGERRSDVAVDITRHVAHGKDPAALPLAIESTADGIRISALQTTRNGAPGRDPDLQAIVTVHVPEDAEIGSIEVFEGRVALTNLHGAVTAEITRGPIDATGLSGRVRLTGHLGDVTVKQATLSPDGLLRLRTFNGTVTLGLAVRPPDARVLAVTYRGSISSTLPLTMKDRFGPRFGEASFGAGEPLISIDVVNGDIRITAPAAKSR